MQELMQKSRQRMIIVLIIALLLVNFVICNSTVKADAWPKSMSINEYNAIPEFNDAGALQRQDYKSTADGSITDRLKEAWNLDDTAQVMEILDNHLNDAGTLTVSWENGLYKVDKVSIKLTEEEKSKYGIATDSEGNANGDTNTWSDLTNDNNNNDDEEGGEDDIGGILFRPIASLICGIGDTCNTLLQRLLIGEKSDAFISRRIFFEF